MPDTPAFGPDTQTPSKPAAPPPMTAEQLRQMYLYAAQLRKQVEHPRVWSEGLQNATGSIMSGLLQHDANAAAAARGEAARASFSPLLQDSDTTAASPRADADTGTGPSNPALAYAESGNNPDAQNPRSSAAGLYQFTRGTWDDTAAKHPDLGLGSYDSGAWHDTGQQEKAKHAFDSDNASMLRVLGQEPSPANLDLAHRFGATGAAHVLSAPPGTQMASIEPSAVMGANPDLAGRTAGDMVGKYTQMAQNSPQPMGSQQRSPVVDQYIRALQAGAALNPDNQAELLSKALSLKQQMAPQYSYNPFGQEIEQFYGQPAHMTGRQLGPGQVEESGIPGIKKVTTIGRDGMPNTTFVGTNNPGPPSSGSPTGNGNATPSGLPPIPTGHLSAEQMRDYTALNTSAVKGMEKQAEENAAGISKLQIKPIADAADKGDIAQKSIEYLKTMRELGDTPDAQKINTGPFATKFLKIKEAVKDLTGYDAGGIASGEALDKLNGFLASIAAKELTSRPTQFDFKTFLERNPGLSVSQEGRGLLIDALQSSYMQDKALADAAQRIKPNELSKWPEIREKVIHDNPINVVFRGKIITTADKIPEFQVRDAAGTVYSTSTPGAVPSGLPPVAPVPKFNHVTGKIDFETPQAAPVPAPATAPVAAPKKKPAADAGNL
jgi:hypothetical protein